jgi:CRP-like cAMP-binding protein
VSFADKPPPFTSSIAAQEPVRDQASTVTVAALQELQALHGIGDEILDALVPRARLLQLEAGQHLLRRGEPNLCVYVVLSGLLSVVAGAFGVIGGAWNGRKIALLELLELPVDEIQEIRRE